VQNHTTPAAWRATQQVGRQPPAVLALVAQVLLALVVLALAAQALLAVLALAVLALLALVVQVLLALVVQVLLAPPARRRATRTLRSRSSLRTRCAPSSGLGLAGRRCSSTRQGCPL